MSDAFLLKTKKKDHDTSFPFRTLEGKQEQQGSKTSACKNMYVREATPPPSPALPISRRTRYFELLLNSKQNIFFMPQNIQHIFFHALEHSCNTSSLLRRIYIKLGLLVGFRDPTTAPGVRPTCGPATSCVQLELAEIPKTFCSRRRNSRCLPRQNLVRAGILNNLLVFHALQTYSPYGDLTLKTAQSGAQSRSDHGREINNEPFKQIVSCLLIEGFLQTNTRVTRHPLTICVVMGYNVLTTHSQLS